MWSVFLSIDFPKMLSFPKKISHLFLGNFCNLYIGRRDKNISPGYPDFNCAHAYPLQHPAHLPGHPGRLPRRGAGLLHQGVRPVHSQPLGDVPGICSPPPGHAQRLLQLPHILLRLLPLQDRPH